MFDRSPSLSHAVPGPPQRAVQQSLGRLSTRVQRQNASEIPSFSAEFHKIAASNSFAKPLARGATDGTNKGPPTVPKLEFTSAVARSSLGIALRDTRQGAVNEGRERGVKDDFQVSLCSRDSLRNPICVYSQPFHRSGYCSE